jgi:tetratricopeptide (TPR) repeat protein
MKGYPIILVLLAVLGCNPSNKLVKQGDAARQKGLDDDAVSSYYNALLSKPNNPKAIEGLTVSGQNVLNQKFARFNQFVVSNQIDDAIKTYTNARKFYQNALDVKVQLRWPDEYEDVYADVRSEYVNTLYDEALVLMNEKKFEAAEQRFERIASLDTLYKGITVLRLNTVLEPLYKQGIIQLNQGKYQQAYVTFSKIVAQDEQYKDAKLRQEEAIGKATTRIGILPIDSMPELEQLIGDKLQKSGFAYIKVTTANELRNVLATRGWGSIESSKEALEAARNLGLQYVLWVKQMQLTYTEEPPKLEQRTAFEAFSENILNPYTGTFSAITKFRKVSYDDSYESRKLSLTIAYSLLAVESGREVSGDQVTFTQQDEQHQFIYAGSIQNLYEQLPTGNFLPPPNPEWKSLFTEVKRQPLSQQQLLVELNRQAARKITTVLNQYFKNKSK